MFARKIIFPDIMTTINRMSGVEVRESHPDNEVRVHLKFATTGGHKNIIPILNHGWLEENRTYFFDMERCPLTLESFIVHDFRSVLGLPLYFSQNLAILDALGFWTIVEHIAKGLNFIHGLGEVHRDLKPSNGCTPNSASSSLFQCFCHFETKRGKFLTLALHSRVRHELRDTQIMHEDLKGIEGPRW
jgi:hypothetical protein